MYDLSNVVITSSPHIKSSEDTRSIMLDVVIALIPSLCVSTYVFGPRAIVMTLVSIIACVLFEAAYDKILKKPSTIGDLSAVVTGTLLAFVVPVTLPYWMLIIGAGISMIFAKCLFGGLGKNFINPALAGRAFLMASWPVAMTTWVAAHGSVSLGSTADAVSVATPMAILKGTSDDTLPSLLNMFLGQIGGSMGEVSALALLVGGAYLLYRKVITIHIPAAYILTVAVLTLIAPTGGLSNIQSMLYNVFGGGLMLGAIFMATDYVTSPVSKKGQVVFGIGCGLLTFMIRKWGGYPEGVCYSIMIMNCTVWLIDKYTRPTKFGAPAKQKKEG
ncbi:MAG: RnfABCDGE type electron transport complex subunit D [Eubacteriales bacterium]|nr:RnfABCDGE type electron transport complex subunit D [Eubacteriales bacterium]